MTHKLDRQPKVPCPETKACVVVHLFLEERPSTQRTERTGEDLVTDLSLYQGRKNCPRDQQFESESPASLGHHHGDHDHDDDGISEKRGGSSDHTELQ